MQKDDRSNIEKVKEILLSSNHAVFFGGAGVSTDSGIPDFRGNGGLYDSEDESNEYYLSSECLENEPEKFFQFFRKNMVFDNAKPNDTHCALATLEKRGVIKAVITQNIDVEAAKSGGVSDPRNSTLIKMFNLIDVGERAGSGIPNIFGVWKKQGWSAPVINESFEPDRITLSLVIGKSGDKKAATKSGDKKAAAKTVAHKQAIIAYLTENISAKSTEIADLLGLKPTRAKEILAEMVDEDILIPEGSNKNRVYRLKS